MYVCNHTLQNTTSIIVQRTGIAKFCWPLYDWNKAMNLLFQPFFINACRVRWGWVLLECPWLRPTEDFSTPTNMLDPHHRRPNAAVHHFRIGIQRFLWQLCSENKTKSVFFSHSWLTWVQCGAPNPVTLSIVCDPKCLRAQDFGNPFKVFVHHHRKTKSVVYHVFIGPAKHFFASCKSNFFWALVLKYFFWILNGCCPTSFCNMCWIRFRSIYSLRAIFLQRRHWFHSLNFFTFNTIFNVVTLFFSSSSLEFRGFYISVLKGSNESHLYFSSQVQSTHTIRFEFPHVKLFVSKWGWTTLLLHAYKQ